MMNPGKSILSRPLLSLKGIEAKFPAQAPRLSTTLGSIADALPNLPDVGIPNLPGGSTASARLPKISRHVKGIEDVMPMQIPKFSDIVGRVEEKGSNVLGKVGNSEVLAPAAKTARLVFE